MKFSKNSLIFFSLLLASFVNQGCVILGVHGGVGATQIKSTENNTTFVPETGAGLLLGASIGSVTPVEVAGLLNVGEGYASSSSGYDNISFTGVQLYTSIPLTFIPAPPIFGKAGGRPMLYIRPGYEFRSYAAKLSEAVTLETGGEVPAGKKIEFISRKVLLAGGWKSRSHFQRQFITFFGELELGIERFDEPFYVNPDLDYDNPNREGAIPGVDKSMAFTLALRVGIYWGSPAFNVGRI